jgi:hypothetical protein
LRNAYTQFDRDLEQAIKQKAHISIANEGTMTDYHLQIEAIVSKKYQSVRGVSETPVRSRSSRLYRCLSALGRLTGPRTSFEIAEESQAEGPIPSGRVQRISDRHVNWILRDVPQLARRVDLKGQKITYELLPAGKAYLDAVLSLT